MKLCGTPTILCNHEIHLEARLPKIFEKTDAVQKRFCDPVKHGDGAFIAKIVDS